MNTPIPHKPVLLRECLELFENVSLKTYVDGTLGASGHAKAILTEHPEIEVFVGIDQDPLALQMAETTLAPWKEKVHLVHGNFEGLEQYLDTLKIDKIDGILLDLGVSSMQLDLKTRGFSFMGDNELDMRMDPTRHESAKTVINEWDETELARILYLYGEINCSRLIAKKIVEARKLAPIETSKQLEAALSDVLWRLKKPGRHPLTQVYQALRIAVNRELEVLEKILPALLKRLNPGGVIAIISFHSLEDRIVKNFLRFAAMDKYDTSGMGGLFRDKVPEVEPITRKPIIPSEEEIQENPRCRSAKLRGARKAG